MGDTGDLVHVERVGNKSKRTKLNVYTPSDLIKITHKHNCSHISNSEDSSNSDSFSGSNDFSKSDNFSESNEFSNSNDFGARDKI